MKPSIHPKYETITVTCSCGHSFETRSTLGRDLTIEVCSNCHPFYTGKQKLLDTGGRVQRFLHRYSKSKEQAPSVEATEEKEATKEADASKSTASKKEAKASKVAKSSKDSKPAKKASKTKE